MLYLKMIFRSWQRAWMSSLISIISLVVGLTCSTLLMLFVLSEYRVAGALGDTNGVFQLETDDSFYVDRSVRSNNVYAPYVYDLADRYSQIKQVVPVIELRCNYDSGGYSRGSYATTPEFAEIFDIGVVEGDLSSTLRSKDEAAITDKFMRALYGRPARIGDRLKFQHGGDTWVSNVRVPPVHRDLVVTTILADPEKTPLNYGMLFSMGGREQIIENQKNGGGSNFAFIKLNDPDKVDELEAVIAADTTRKSREWKVYFRPFDQVYLNGAMQSKWSSDFIQRRDPSLLTIGFTVALLVLAIAVFNYINITMTRARGRLRNLVSQRIFGASKWAVRLQTLLDTLLMVLLSFVLALLIINALIPTFNSFMSSYVSLSDLLIDWAWLQVIVLLVAVVAFSSAYILLKLHTTTMIETLKNPMGRGVKVSSVMVVAQFVISIALVAVSMNISRQLIYISTSVPAFSSVLRISSSEVGMIPFEFRDHISSMSWVEGYSLRDLSNSISMSSDDLSINGMSGGNDVLKFYGLKLKEGRLFEPGDSSICVIVNETLLRSFDLKPPYVNQEFDFMGKYRIIGVVEDFMYEDAHKKIQPLKIGNDDASSVNRTYEYELYLKVTGDCDSRMEDIQAIWHEKYPQKRRLEIKSMPEIIRERHASDERTRTMVDVMMAVSLILTAIGLFGLAFYTVARRTREIAIRKVYGSTSAEVVLLLCRTFVIWVVVAALIALPIAYFVSDWWLSGFVYHVNIEWWVFALTIIIVSVIAFATVIFQTLSAARANPANSIKAE